jgi:radical SAM superfamily enzyme YgiQ (UPF0313 family)
MAKLETGPDRKNRVSEDNNKEASKIVCPDIESIVIPKFEIFKKLKNLPGEFNVLLIKTAIEHPISDEDLGVPMGLYVLKDYLITTGHNLIVDVWDERLELKEEKSDEKRKQLKCDNTLFSKKLDEKEYDAVGISMCTSEVLPALEKFRIAKIKRPATITFCGGIFTSFNEECLLKTDWIDFVIPGIATKPLGDLLVQLYHQKMRSRIEPKEIDVYGVMSKNKIGFSKLVWTCSRLPTMQLSMWSEIFKLYGDELKKKAGIYTARGCNRECEFCSVQKENKQEIFTRSEGCVIDEINFLKENGCTSFSFKDENFLSSFNQYRIFKIMKKVKGEGIKFKIRARYDNVLAIINYLKGKDFLEVLKKCGIDEIQYGIETYDEKIRRKINKIYFGGAENEDNIVDFIKSHADYGIIANCSFILGLKGEDYDYYEHLIKFIERIYDRNGKSDIKPKIYLNYSTPHPYKSNFPDKNNYTLVTHDLNYFTHRFPVCFPDGEDIQRNKRMLITHNKIADITDSRRYNPSLGEDTELYEAFTNCDKKNDTKVNLMSIYKEYVGDKKIKC